MYHYAVGTNHVRSFGVAHKRKKINISSTGSAVFTGGLVAD